MGDNSVTDITYQIMSTLFVQLHDVLEQIISGTSEATDTDLRVLREVLDATSSIIIDVVGYF